MKANSWTHALPAAGALRATWATRNGQLTEAIRRRPSRVALDEVEKSTPSLQPVRRCSRRPPSDSQDAPYFRKHVCYDQQLHPRHLRARPSGPADSDSKPWMPPLMSREGNTLRPVRQILNRIDTDPLSAARRRSTAHRRCMAELASLGEQQ